MNYLYTPTSPVTTPAIGPYFAVGNECCNGGMSNDVDAITKVTWDYTDQLPAGVNVNSVSYTITSTNPNLISLTNEVLTGNTATFMVSGGVAGASYLIESMAFLSDGQVWVDKITVTVTQCGGQQTLPPSMPIIGNGISMEALPVLAVNTLPTLSYVADNNIMVLFVNGQAFFPIGPQAAFTVNSQTITWTSTIYSLTPGAAVIALYTHL